MDKNFNLTIRLFLYKLNWCKEFSEEDLRKIETCWEFWWIMFKNIYNFNI